MVKMEKDLGIDDNSNCLFEVGSFIKVDGTQAVCVAHHRNSSIVLDVSDETVTSARDD